MVDTYFSLSSYIIAKVATDPAQARGEGGPDYPRLVFPLEFKFSALTGGHFIHRTDQSLPESDLIVLSFGAQLCYENVSARFSDSLRSAFHYLIQSTDVPHHFQLEFPLDNHRIERIEQRRKGDVLLHFRMQLGVATFGVPRWGKPENQPKTSRISDVQMIHSDLQVTVPQSVWVKSVLPGLGYGVVQLVELPLASLAACESMRHSYDALFRAHDKFKTGDYDEAVWLCRTAVDPLREELRKLKNGNADSLAADWAEKIGPATVEWLTVVFGKTHGVANTPAHSPRTGHFNRLDAQMILHTTTGIVAYVARTRTIS